MVILTCLNDLIGPKNLKPGHLILFIWLNESLYLPIQIFLLQFIKMFLLMISLPYKFKQLEMFVHFLWGSLRSFDNIVLVNREIWSIGVRQSFHWESLHALVLSPFFGVTVQLRVKLTQPVNFHFQNIVLWVLLLNGYWSRLVIRL